MATDGCCLRKTHWMNEGTFSAISASKFVKHLRWYRGSQPRMGAPSVSFLFALFFCPATPCFLLLSSFMWNGYISMSGMLKCTSKALLHVVLICKILLQFSVLYMCRNGLCPCAWVCHTSTHEGVCNPNPNPNRRGKKQHSAPGSCSLVAYVMLDCLAFVR